jgi:hypothetical protein
MAKTYAAVWQRADQARRVGKLAVDESVLRFEGAQPGSADRDEVIGAGEIATVAVARAGTARLDGLPTVVVTLNDGVAVRIASLDGPGTVSEIARRVADLTLRPTAA